ncbi:MAG: hypothetical protein ABIC95_04320 [archaeon]
MDHTGRNNGDFQSVSDSQVAASDESFDLIRESDHMFDMVDELGEV